MSQVIQFHYQIKRPKLLQNDVFILYSPQKLKFEPGEKKIVDMKLNIQFPLNVTGSCKLLFQLSNAGLILQNCNYLYGDAKLHFELVNSNLTRLIKIKTKSEIGYFMPDNNGRKMQYEFVELND